MGGAGKDGSEHQVIDRFSGAISYLFWAVDGETHERIGSKCAASGTGRQAISWEVHPIRVTCKGHIRPAVDNQPPTPANHISQTGRECEQITRLEVFLA